jgi:hypothetical protein
MLTHAAVGRFGAHMLYFKDTLAIHQDEITRVLDPGEYFADPMLRNVAIDVYNNKRIVPRSCAEAPFTSHYSDVCTLLLHHTFQTLNAHRTSDAHRLAAVIMYLTPSVTQRGSPEAVCDACRQWPKTSPQMDAIWEVAAQGEVLVPLFNPPPSWPHDGG